MEAYNKLINPKAFRAVAISTTLQNGTLQYRELALLNPNEKSPLLDIIPTKAVNTEILHFAPKDAIMAVAVSNGDGEQRWNKLIKLIDDALPPNLLGGQQPSAHIKAFEQQIGVDFGRDLMGKTTNIGFALGNPLFAPVQVKKTVGPNFTSVSSGPQIPMVLILEAKDQQAAEQLIGVIVKLSQKAAGKEIKPRSQQVKGQTVHSLRINDEYAVEYVQVGDTVVVGPYTEGVAQALADGAAKKGLLGDPKVMAQIKDAKDPIAVTAIKPGTLLIGMSMISYSGSMSKTAVGPIEKKEGFPAPPPGRRGQQPKTTITIEKDPPHVAKMKKELGAILELEPWLITTTTRGEGFIMEEGKSPGWNKFVPKLVNFAVEKMLQERTGFGGGGKFSPPDHGHETPVPEVRPERPDIKKEIKPIPSPSRGGKKKDAQPDKKSGKEVLKVSGELTKKDTLKDGFYRKAHAVKLEPGKKYTVTLAGHKDKFFDTYVIVQDQKGKTLAEKDDGDGLNARVTFTPKQAGTYQILVTSFREGETGKYVLTVTE
jgi:hypothetical protein